MLRSACAVSRPLALPCPSVGVAALGVLRCVALDTACGAESSRPIHPSQCPTCDPVPAGQAHDARREAVSGTAGGTASEAALDGLSTLAYSPAKRRKGAPVEAVASSASPTAAPGAAPAPAPATRDPLPAQSPAPPPWEVLKSLGAKCASEGGATHTVAARGLLKGAKASLPHLEVRALEPVQFLPSHESVAKALQAIASGQMHAARAHLGHDDVSSVGAFCKQWHKHWKVPVPPLLADCSEQQLSAAALNRIRSSGKRSAPLPCPLIVEACLKDPGLVGCRFEHGGELGEVLGEEATYAMRVTSNEHEWVSAKELRTRLHAEGQTIHGSILVSGCPDSVNVLFGGRIEDQDDSGDEILWHALPGQRPVSSSQSPPPPPPSSSSTAADTAPADSRQVLIALGVSNTLLRALSPFKPKGAEAQDQGPGDRGAGAVSDASVEACHLADQAEPGQSQEAKGKAHSDAQEEQARATQTGSVCGLLPWATPGARLQGRCSLVQKSIRRGSPGLCGQQPLLEACAALLAPTGPVESSGARKAAGGGDGEEVLPEMEAGDGRSASCLLWCLFVTAVEDVTPYLPHARRPHALVAGAACKPETKAGGALSASASTMGAQRAGHGNESAPELKVEGQRRKIGRADSTHSSGMARAKADIEVDIKAGRGRTRGSRAEGKGNSCQTAQLKPELQNSVTSGGEGEEEGEGGEGEEAIGRVLSMAEMVALALMCKADPNIRLPRALQLRVVGTALRLQRTCATMPWRGWRHLKTDCDFAFFSAKGDGAGMESCATLASDAQGGSAAAPAMAPPPDLSPWGSAGDAPSAVDSAGGGSDKSGTPAKKVAELEGQGAGGEAEEEARAVVDAMRAGALLLASGTEVDTLTVYIRAHHVWTKLLHGLEHVDQTALRMWPAVEKETDARLSQLNEEVYVASYDPSVVPNMLLLVQAGLPFAPRHPRQHSLQGLARAMIKLSSGANQRQELPLLLERVAAFRGREVLHDASEPSPASDCDDRDETRNKTETVMAKEESPAEAEEDALGSGGDGAGHVSLYTSANQVVAQGADLSPHETALLHVMKSVQSLVLREHRDRPPLPPTCPVFQRQRSIGGRTPSHYESRAAFLMLFGDTHHLTLKLAEGGANMSVAVTIAGVKGRALLVQRLGANEMALEEESEGDASEGDARVGAEAVAQFGFVQDPMLRRAAQQALLTTLAQAHPEGMRLRLRKPPHGFQWASFLAGGAENAEVRVRVEGTRPSSQPSSDRMEIRQAKGCAGTRKRKSKSEEVADGGDAQEPGQDEEEEEEDGLRFFVEGREVEAFNAAVLLEPCNEASEVIALKGYRVRFVSPQLCVCVCVCVCVGGAPACRRAGQLVLLLINVVLLGPAVQASSVFGVGWAR